MASKNQTNTATMLWQKQQKCNAEFFALMYGALVAEMVRDLEDNAAIENELDRMGHSIGIRCIEEVLAKASPRVTDFESTASIVGLAWKMFFGSNLDITSKVADRSYVCKILENPLETFVELPEFNYSILYAGWVRGMLEMLQFDVQVTLQDNELTVELKQILQEGAGEDYHEE